VANRCRGRGVDAAGGVDDGNRDTAAVQGVQPLLDLAGVVNRLNNGLGINAAALPV
jgi:hypothetical protein